MSSSRESFRLAKLLIIYLDRFFAQAAFVAETHLGESDLDFGEQQYGQLLSMNLDLDTFVVGIGFAKQSTAVVCNDPDVTVKVDDADVDEVVFTRLQSLIDFARTVRSLNTYIPFSDTLFLLIL